MKPLLYVLLFAGSMVFNVHIHAMNIEVKGNQVFASGAINGEDFLKFEKAFSRPEVDTVALINSPGGDMWAGLSIGRMIAGKGYKTITAGFCVSACSLLFIAGRERRFANTFNSKSTFIGIHGAHDVDTDSLIPQANIETYAFLKKQIGDKFNTEIINTALYKIKDASGFLRIPENARNPNAKTVFCPTFKLPTPNCTTFNEVSALSLGVITHEDLVTLDLPPAFRQNDTLFGRPLSEKIPDMDSYLSNFAQQKCFSDSCKRDLIDYANKSNHRALATGISNIGFGLSYDKPTIELAALFAVYMCNHMNDRPIQLCELAAADNFDIRPTLELHRLENLEASKKIFTPPEKYYANENFGGGFFSMKKIYASKLADIPPMEIDGVHTVSTQELAQRLQSATPPILIDVGFLSTSIPNAEKLMFGGMAFDDGETESAFSKRFNALLHLLAPESDRPLVIFSATRDQFSANAGLRARQAGYTQVLWYRGGTEAWMAAKLPTAVPAMRAVAH